LPLNLKFLVKYPDFEFEILGGSPPLKIKNLIGSSQSDLGFLFGSADSFSRKDFALGSSHNEIYFCFS
jgi:hypothetical protein